jgi:hypothetical protein
MTLANPQRWDRYAYVVNNPLDRLDPDGAADVYVTIWRDTSTSQSTTGRIDMRGVNGETLSGYYLEPEIKGAGGIHPKGHIPEGEYSASFFPQLHHLDKNGHPIQALFALDYVPGFSDIDVHNGNFPHDTTGCFLYGTGLAPNEVIGSAAFRSQAMSFLNSVADDDNKKIQDLTIDIEIPVGNIDSPMPDNPVKGDGDDHPADAFCHNGICTDYAPGNPDAEIDKSIQEAFHPSPIGVTPMPGSQ